jgi:hypothetical protein
MNQAQVNNSDLLLFDEALPIGDMNSPRGFKSECIPDKKVKVDDLLNSGGVGAICKSQSQQR